MSVLVKSRLVKGRLRVAYYDSRDTKECIGADDNDSLGFAEKEWEDDGGGGRNTGLSKYAQVKPEGQGEAAVMEPLGDQSNIWAKELMDMSERQGVQWTQKNTDGTLQAPFGEDGGDHNSALFGQALNGSVNSGVETKDGVEESSVNPKGVDLGVGKGKHYDHVKGFNAGRNTLEIAKTTGLSPDPKNPFRPETSGAEVGENDEDNHSISHMSDISSGELMQRFPPSKAVDNTFVAALYKGLFTDVERKDCFMHVLPEVELVLQEQHERLVAKQARLNLHNNEGEEEVSDDLLADPLYELFSTLERRINEADHKNEDRIEEMFRVLNAIRNKTDTIKERRLLRPADFE